MRMVLCREGLCLEEATQQEGQKQPQGKVINRGLSLRSEHILSTKTPCQGATHQPGVSPWLSPALSSQKSFPQLLQSGIPRPLEVALGSSHPQPHTAPQRPHLGTNSARKRPSSCSTYVHCQNLLLLSSPGNQVPSQSRLAFPVSRPAQIRTHRSPQSLRHHHFSSLLAAVGQSRGPARKDYVTNQLVERHYFWGSPHPDNTSFRRGR